MACILLVDDDNFLRKTIAKMFDDHYTIIQAADGDQGLELALEHLPDVIILDVEMPGKNGYEVCDVIRHTSGIETIPVLFLSGKDELRSRLQGFEAGGNDYLAKPVAPDLLRAKVKVLVKNHEDVKHLNDEKQQAHQVALDAMRGSSELGQAMQFVERCQVKNTEEAIAEELINICTLYDVNVIVGTKNEDLWHYFSDLQVSPLEKEVIKTLHSQGRFVDFGIRTQINYPNVSLLIKNMPLDHADKYGRLKDTFPGMLAVVNLRLHSIRENQAIHEQTELMSRSIESLQPLLETVISNVESFTFDNKQSLSEFLEQMVFELPKLGLEEDQEEYILKKIELLVNHADDMLKTSDEARNSLELASKIMYKLLKKQKRIEEIINEPQELEVAAALSANEEENDIGGDVELF